MKFRTALAWSALLSLGSALPATAQESSGTAGTFRGAGTAERADVSPPFRDIPPSPGVGGKAEREELESNLMQPCGPLEAFDPVAQEKVGSPKFEIPGTVAGFDGWVNACGGCAPPDPVGDIGPSHYVAMANSTIAVYSRAGAVLLSPRNINTLWSGFGGACQTENAGDPVVLYDQIADRWLISQFTAAGPTYYNCVALSVTNDPTGSWQRYAFTTGANFPDYPKYGIWRDGYYISTREFDPAGPFAGAGAYALNRTQMLAGSLSPQVISFILAPGGSSYYPGDGLLPVDVDGTTQPPAGADELYLGSMDNGGPYSAPQDAINVFKFHVDWATPGNSSFTRSATVPVAAFDSTFTPCGGGRACIPQSGTTNMLDILSYRQRLLHRAAYRNMGAYQTIVTNQSVQGVSSPTAIAGIRWYELRDPNGTPTIYQQGTYVPGSTDGIHRWMGSAAMDRVGNIAVGYSASSASIFPDIRYTGRLNSDPLGTLPQGEGIFVAGGGSQTLGGNRWGDYTSMNVDPTDDCTFWYVSEYYKSTSGSNWNVRVGAFRFPNCLCAVPVTAPVATSATASAANRITVAWNDSTSATVAQYILYRATVSGGPYSQIATISDTSPGSGSVGTYSYNDNTVSGGTTYYYVLRSTDGATCTSGDSNQISATATGICALPPTFAGLSTVTNPGNATCTLNLSWSAATSNCAAAITHNVYRSASTPVNPSGGNRIASGVSPTNYSDGTGLVSGTTYYYVVRAVDVPSGNEDANVVERSGIPTGPITSGTVTETFEGALSGGGFDNAGWTHQALAGAVDWVWSTARSQTPTHSWFSASQTTATDRVLVSPSFGILAGTTLSFWHTYDFEGTTATCYDGGTLEISTDGGSSWNVLPDVNFTSGAFTGTANSGFSNPIGGKRSWCDGTIGALTQVTANLGSFAGTVSAKLRWHEGDDSTTIATGWYVDSVTITNAGTAGSCTTGSGCTAPGAPNLAVPTSGCSGVALSWTAGTGTTASYNVYRAAGTCPGSGWSKIAGPLAVTTHTDTTGTPGTTYSYRIRGACDAGGATESVDSNCRTVVASGAPAAPGAPTLTAGCGSMGLSWSAVAGATDYEVWGIAGAGCGSAAQIASSTAGATTFDHTPLAYGAQYSYFVKAKNSCGTSAAGTCAMATTLGTPTFGGITSVTNASSATCTLNLAWSAGAPSCPGASVSYRIYRSTTTPVVPGAPTLIASGVAGAAYVDAVGLVSGTTYYYRVHAVDSISGIEETNSVEQSGVPTGPVVSGTFTDDGGDTGLAKLAGATPWAAVASGGNVGPKAYATGNYGGNVCAALTTPALSLGAGAALSFASKYDIQTNRDVGVVEIATGPTFATWTKLAIVTYPDSNSRTTNACAYPVSGANTVFSKTTAAPTYPAGAYTASLAAYNGQQVKIRWNISSDNNAVGTNSGWWIDDVAVTNVLVSSSCTTGTGVVPKPAPDGQFVSGTPMTAKKAGGSADVKWDVLACPSSNYSIYWGALPSFGGFTGGSCGVGTLGTATAAVPSDSFFVVAGTAGGAVSEFGRDSTGTRETFTGWATICPTESAQNISGTCP